MSEYLSGEAEYLEELLERASGDYDPYEYVEDREDPVSFDEETLFEWDWD